MKITVSRFSRSFSSSAYSENFYLKFYWWTVWEMKGFVTRNMYMKISQLRKFLVRISLQMTEKLYNTDIAYNSILQFNILNPAIPSVRYSIFISSICEQNPRLEYSKQYVLEFYWWTVWETLASVARSLQPLVDGLGNPMHL